MDTRTAKRDQHDEEGRQDPGSDIVPPTDHPPVHGIPGSEPPPQLASVDALWTRPVRVVVVALVLLAITGYLLFGSVLARNVTFNRLVDPGAKNGIPRFVRESVMSVWQTMWDRAPAFGSVDLTRTVLMASTLVFFLAFAVIIATVFIPSRHDWSSGIDDGQPRDASPGD